MKKWIHKARGIVSLILIAIFIIETVTGIGLYLAPQEELQGKRDGIFLE